jgi:acetyl/propionyl-CoA carboxylase alpha subunit
MIAKVIAHALTREQALERLAGALDACAAEGIRINAAFLAAALRSEEMRAGQVDTHLLERLRTRDAAARRPA